MKVHERNKNNEYRKKRVEKRLKGRTNQEQIDAERQNNLC